MIAVNLLLSHLRPVNLLCARVSILLSDARAVALSVRQSQSFQRKLSSRVPNVIRSARFSCLAPDSHQEVFLSTRSTSLSLRGGIHKSMVKPIAREISRSRKSFLCVAIQSLLL